MNRLNGKSFRTKKIYPVTADEVATKIMQNSKGRVPDNQKKRVNQNFIHNFRNCQSSDLASPFTSSEVTEALRQMSCGKAPGYDEIFPDYLVHLGHKAINWLAKLFTRIIDSGILPKTWKNAKVVAVLKPNKPAEDTSNYRPISLLSCSLKLFEGVYLEESNRLSKM